MKFFPFVLKNLLRRKSRLVLTVIGIMIGVCALTVLLLTVASLEGDVREKASNLGGNLVITPKGWCAYEQINVLLGEHLPEQIPLSELDKISRLEGVKAVVPYLTESTAINNSPVMVVGVMPGNIQTIKHWQIKEGAYFTNGLEALIGEGIAQQFHLGVGAHITIRGEQFTIIGVLQQTSTSDDIAIFIPLATAQRIYKVDDRVSFATVVIDDVSKADVYIAKIRDVANADVISDKQLADSALSIIASVKTSINVITFVAIATAIFMTMNTMMMAVYERRREIGILRSMGAARGFIFRLFIAEAALIGLLGGILGLFIGHAIAYLVMPYLSNQLSFTAPTHLGMLSLPLMFGVVVAAVLMAVLAALYPAWRAFQFSPLEVMNNE